MNKRMLLLIPVGAFVVCGAIGYLAGMPRSAPLVSAAIAQVPPAASVTTIGDTAAGDAPTVDQEWLLRTGAAAGIPVRALEAYATAAHLIGTAQPQCQLGWNTLAAVGSVESDHGRHGGGALGDDGVVTPALVGPALDGQGVAEIRDTDQGRLDGDRVWDRAVGPLQFVPDTWARHGVDADGDGNADPYDIDDAALTAAAYLCEAGGDLSTAEGWTAAVLSYNHLDSYAEAVRVQAASYATLTTP